MELPSSLRCRCRLETHMAAAETIVFVIDDDPSFLRSTAMLIESSGVRVQAFNSAEEFLRNRRPDVPACLVLARRLNPAVLHPSRSNCRIRLAGLRRRLARDQ
jgi:ActR/RegA family two-component response regulator